MAKAKLSRKDRDNISTKIKAAKKTPPCEWVLGNYPIQSMERVAYEYLQCYNMVEARFKSGYECNPDNYSIDKIKAIQLFETKWFQKCLQEQLTILRRKTYLRVIKEGSDSAALKAMELLEKELRPPKKDKKKKDDSTKRVGFPDDV